MAFTKFHPLVCQRAVIYQGEIIQGKPEICVDYFSMRNPYMKFQDDISNMNTYIHTYIHTYGQAETICPRLLQSWGHNNNSHLHDIMLSFFLSFFTSFCYSISLNKHCYHNNPIFLDRYVMTNSADPSLRPDYS